MPTSARLRRLAALLALAPFLAGAHCKEALRAPAVQLVGGRHLERTLYGPGVFSPAPPGQPLAPTLAPFERREVRVDASRPVAVLLTSAPYARGPCVWTAGASRPATAATATG